MADPQQVLKVDMIPFDLKSFLKDVYCINKVVIFQMDVYFFNSIFDESVSFDFFLHSLDNVVDFFVIFAWRVVLSVD